MNMGVSDEFFSWKGKINQEEDWNKIELEIVRTEIKIF